MSLNKLKLFADGAKKESIVEMYANPQIAGFTTNPTLMVKAGVSDYKAFALDVLETVKEKPICFEVFSDDLVEMEAQALEIASWGHNVYVKVPITNTLGQSCVPLMARLCQAGVKVNMTAITTLAQVEEIIPLLHDDVPAYVSVFAGRIADCGVDPLPTMRGAVELLGRKRHAELIWASPREVLNVVQAADIGCHIITLTDDIVKKLPTLGKDLGEMSLDTVKMFYNDAAKAGYHIETSSDNNPRVFHKLLRTVEELDKTKLPGVTAPVSP